MQGHHFEFSSGQDVFWLVHSKFLKNSKFCVVKFVLYSFPASLSSKSQFDMFSCCSWPIFTQRTGYYEAKQTHWWPIWQTTMESGVLKVFCFSHNSRHSDFFGHDSQQSHKWPFWPRSWCFASNSEDNLSGHDSTYHEPDSPAVWYWNAQARTERPPGMMNQPVWQCSVEIPSQAGRCRRAWWTCWVKTWAEQCKMSRQARKSKQEWWAS